MTGRGRPSRYEPASVGRRGDVYRCDSCGGPVLERGRWRHPSCKPPTIPLAYRVARRKLTVITNDRTDDES